VRDIASEVEALAPVALKEDWDNVGLMVGESDARVRKVLVALDVVDGVIDEALSAGADMIVAHHPLIFGGLKSVTSDTPTGRRIIRLLRANIAVYAAHTNLDSAEGGVNDALFGVLGLAGRKVLMGGAENAAGLGRVGDLPTPVPLGEFAKFVRERLGAPHISFCGEASSPVSRVGLCGGAACDTPFLQAAKAQGCHVYITGDVKYHKAQEAADLGLCLIDATHYYSEVHIVPLLCRYLAGKFPHTEVVPSAFNPQTMQIVRNC